MDLIDQLLDDELLLLQQSLQILNILMTSLDVQVVGVVLHVRLVAFLAAALLSLQPFLPPVPSEQTLLEKGLSGLTAFSLHGFNMSRAGFSVGF